MSRISAKPRTTFGIAEEGDDAFLADPFVDAFIRLGSLLRNSSSAFPGRQLVVAISVPRRDFVAALIGAGWTLSAPAPSLKEPIEVFRAASPTTYLRAVTDQRIVTGRFSWLDETRDPPRVLTGGKVRTTVWYKAVAVLDSPVESVEEAVPRPGFLGSMTGAADTWLARVAAPAQDLALVGVSKWIREDLEASIGEAGEDGLKSPDDSNEAPLANYVLPETARAASWSTVIIPSARLGEGTALPAKCKAVVLDRYGAIKYLNDITAPVVVCVVDRSVADDSSAELVVQARLANSQPISVRDDIGWQPPLAIEALAFTVAL